MPLYEVVLRYDDREEIRLTDTDPQRDGRLYMNGRAWRIVASKDGPTPQIERRFIARPVPVVAFSEVLEGT